MRGGGKKKTPEQGKWWTVGACSWQRKKGKRGFDDISSTLKKGGGKELGNLIREGKRCTSSLIPSLRGGESLFYSLSKKKKGGRAGSQQLVETAASKWLDN